jgi:hypothetical protein
MARTTFSGPVASDNGFIGGTSTEPITVTTAQNVSSFYVTSSATTGDTRLSYMRMDITSTGSGETLRAFTRVTGAGAAAGGTINGAHISTSINTTGTISGAANALRTTLGGSATTPGGTLAVLQLDTDYSVNVTLGATSAFIRVTDSGTQTGEVQNLVNIETGPAATVAPTASAVPASPSKVLKVMVGGTAYYVPAYASFTP